MAYEYDKDNIFAKIISEIPNQTVLETEHSLAFNYKSRCPRARACNT